MWWAETFIVVFILTRWRSFWEKKIKVILPSTEKDVRQKTYISKNELGSSALPNTTCLLVQRNKRDLLALRHQRDLLAQRHQRDILAQRHQRDLLAYRGTKEIYLSRGTKEITFPEAPKRFSFSKFAFGRQLFWG